VAAEAVRVSDYIRPLGALELKASILVFDAARKNPFAISGPPLAGGLALIEPSPGMLVAFNAIGQLRGEHFQPAAQVCSLQALKTLQPLWVRHQIGPWSEASKRIVVVPSEMLAHGGQVRKTAVDIQALWQVWIAEVNQANKRNWDFRSCRQLLRPLHLLDGILGDELVPDEALYLPRAGCSEIVIEKVSSWQRGVIPDKSFKSRVFPCENTVAVGSAVVEMSVCIDDCCPAGQRGSCHLLSLQRDQSVAP
jgi:hypothetical protein